MLSYLSVLRAVFTYPLPPHEQHSLLSSSSSSSLDYEIEEGIVKAVVANRLKRSRANVENDEGSDSADKSVDGLYSDSESSEDLQIEKKAETLNIVESGMERGKKRAMAKLKNHGISLVSVHLITDTISNILYNSPEHNEIMIILATIVALVGFMAEAVLIQKYGPFTNWHPKLLSVKNALVSILFAAALSSNDMSGLAWVMSNFSQSLTLLSLLALFSRLHTLIK